MKFAVDYQENNVIERRADSRDRGADEFPRRPEHSALRPRVGQVAGCSAAAIAAAIALLAGTATAIAQDSRVTAVPVEGMDATSWLCALDAGDLSSSVSPRQSASAWASDRALGNFPGLDAWAGFRPGGAANGTVASQTADQGVDIGVGLCRESLVSGSPVLPPAQPGLDLGATPDTAPTGSDLLTSAGLSLTGYVDIPDAALRRAVEQALGKRVDEPISPVDMAGLTSLSARGAGIVDLSGLELAVRLEHLDLYGNDVSDITPLAGLSSLEMLSLAHNRIRDDAFPTLSQLTGLEVLSLAGNVLDDWSQWQFYFPRLRVLDLASTSVDGNDLGWLVSGLPYDMIEGLYLGGNDIQDIGPLGSLWRLKWLMLGGNAIEDIAPLTGLTDLRALSLEGNAVGDLSPLGGLSALETLDLGNNSIEDISALAGLIELRQLDLWRNAISDLSPLAGLTGLEVLRLRENAIEDISALAGLTALHTLHIPWNAIEDISALAGLIELEELHLWRNAIADVSPLAGLTGLRELSLAVNAIEDISSLAGLIELRELNLARNAITDISPLSALDYLEILYLGENGIEDISVLAGRPELVELGLEDNAIVDISVLAGLTGLEVLLLGANPVNDISVLAGLTRLQELDLSRMGIADEDLQVLAGLTELRKLDLHTNNIADISALAGLTAMEELQLQGNAIDDLSPLAQLGGLVWLDLAGNAVKDLDPLTHLRGLLVLDLRQNAVEDILPLVRNDGLAHGDSVVLYGNPLSPASRDNLIPDLQARGVVVEFDGLARVSIPDDALRGAIESALGKEDGDPITAAEMEDLTELVVPSAGIEDLAGLEHAVNLSRLELKFNDIKDLSPLAELTSLEVLDLWDNAIDDLSPLAGLANLKHLWVGKNDIEDLTPLAGLTGLELLDLGDNVVIERIEPLAGLTGLRVLSLSGNNVGNLAPLAGLTNLQRLWLDQNVIGNLSPLAGLTGLIDLRLADNAIDDLSPLAALTGLSSLYLANNAVADISPLIENAGLGDGDFVSLTGNPLSEESTGVHIPALEARGIEVEFDAASGVSFSAQRVITTDAGYVTDVYAADMDGDGDPDVLSASGADNEIVWYENLGAGTLAAARVITSDVANPASVRAADLDGDGDADVLSASLRDNKVAWYENLGEGDFSAQRVITVGADGATSVHAADLDGDGDADVLSASFEDHKIAWYENLGNGEFSSERAITTSARRAASVHAADLDGDGDADVLFAKEFTSEVAWFENLGRGTFSAERTITRGDASLVVSVYAADLNGDGNPDVLSASWNDNKIAWYENLGEGVFSAQRVISAEADGALSVYAADLDGDGDSDVLSGSSYDNKIAWYENLGGGSFSAQRVITNEGSPASGVLDAVSVHAADLDGDGDADVLSASARDDKIAWYENLSNHGDDHGDAPESATLATALPAFLHGTLESGGDRDVFRFATGSGTLRAYSNGRTDTFGTLLDADGDVLAENDDREDLNFLIEAAVGAGVHYVQVSGFADISTGPYTLSIEFVSADGGGPFDTTFTPPTRSETVVVGGIEIEAAENEILVFLDEDVSSEELSETQAEITDRGGQVKSLNFDLRTIQVGITDAIVEQDFIDALSEQSGVSGANVNEVVEPDQSFITSNEQGYRQWSTRLVDIWSLEVPAPSPVSFAGDYWINQIDATSAWTALSDPSVSLAPNKIGIVDTGVPSPNDVLSSSRISRYTEAGVSLSGDDSSDPHGYNVTGYAAGYGNAPDRRGVNPHSDVVFVDVLRRDDERTYVTNLLQGIKIAIINGAGVVNISWGDISECSDPASTRLSSRQRWRLNKIGAVHYARQRDVLLVWSAGNECEKQDDRLLPLRNGAIDVANTDSWLSHTLIVGASADSRMDACFSRMGGVVNIMAPGVSVGFGDRTGSGTSYAAPMVTGAAGLVRAIESTISAEETRSLLINSAKNSITFNTTCEEPVASSPAGLLNLDSAIQSSLVAHGVGLNIAGDVHLARGRTTSVPINVTLPAGGVNAIDVGFVIDQSGSYSDDIQTLQNRATEIVDNLRSRTDVDVQFGVVGFADFPQDPYGETEDVPYRLYQGITDDADALIAAIDILNKPLMNGNDIPESQYEALFRASREIGWREGALRILLVATDADFHDSDTESGYPGTGRAATLATLAAENIIVIGLQSGGSSAAAQRLQELADATGGSVLSLDAASSQIVAAVERGLDAALAEVDVTLDVLAGQRWVTGITPTVHRDVRPGDTVNFTVSLQGQRDPSIQDLPYNVYLWARGDGSALLSRTKIPIIVPKQ